MKIATCGGLGDLVPSHTLMHPFEIWRLYTSEKYFYLAEEGCITHVIQGPEVFKYLYPKEYPIILEKMWAYPSTLNLLQDVITNRDIGFLELISQDFYFGDLDYHAPGVLDNLDILIPYLSKALFQGIAYYAVKEKHVPAFKQCLPFFKDYCQLFEKLAGYIDCPEFLKLIPVRNTNISDRTINQMIDRKLTQNLKYINSLYPCLDKIIHCLQERLNYLKDLNNV